MVVLLEYVWLVDDPRDNVRTSDTLALGSTLKKMVTVGSETLMVVSAFVSFSNLKVLLITAEAFG